MLLEHWNPSHEENLPWQGPKWCGSAGHKREKELKPLARKARGRSAVLFLGRMSVGQMML